MRAFPSGVAINFPFELHARERLLRRLTAFASLQVIQNMDKNELVKLVSSKTGLNEEMATLAVDTVIGFLKQKLPPELSAQLDSLLSGQESSSGIMDAVKGLFGKKDG